VKNKIFYFLIILFACLLSFFGFYLVGKGVNYLFFNKPHTQITATSENKEAGTKPLTQEENLSSNINSQQKGYNSETVTNKNSKPITESNEDNFSNSTPSNTKSLSNLLYKVRVGPFDNEQDSVNIKKDLFKLGYSSILLKANGSYWLQIAAVTKKEDALNLVKDLKMKGINAKIISEQ